MVCSQLWRAVCTNNADDWVVDISFWFSFWSQQQILQPFVRYEEPLIFTGRNRTRRFVRKTINKKYLHMKKIYALSFAALLLLGACKNHDKKAILSGDLTKEYKGLNAGAGNYEIDAPGGWEKKDTTMNGIKVTFLFAPDIVGNVRSSLN